MADKALTFTLKNWATFEPPEFTIKVLVFYKSGFWIGRCLEYDVEVQAEKYENIQYELECTFTTLIKSKVDFIDNKVRVHPEYWTRWNNTKAN